jgi:hypothetical protein
VELHRRAGQALALGGGVALFLGTPVALGLFGLLLYNRLRFDAWLEFGRRYQMSWIEMEAHARFLWPNLYAYLRRPAVWSCRFPFAYAILDMGLRGASLALCVGMFTAQSIAPSFVNASAPRAKGGANALYLSFYYVGGTLGSVVPGLAWQAWRWPGVVAVCAASLALAMLADAFLCGAPART